MYICTCSIIKKVNVIVKLDHIHNHKINRMLKYRISSKEVEQQFISFKTGHHKCLR